MIRFESPGGHVQPAMEVASIIRQRGLDTYVGRFCASACTLALLAGRQRWLAPDAELGFHQAHAPGVPAAEVGPLLRRAYQTFAIAPPFIDHVLRTPPEELWRPRPPKLRAAGAITGEAPAELVALDDGQSRNLRDVTRYLPLAPDRALLQLAAALTDLLDQLEAVNPEACWAFAHDGAIDLASLLPRTVIDPVAAAERRITDAAAAAPAAAPSAAQRRATVTALVRSMRAGGHGAILDGLRADADHAAFCPALRSLLQSVLALPEPDRVSTCAPCCPADDHRRPPAAAVAALLLLAVPAPRRRRRRSAGRLRPRRQPRRGRVPPAARPAVRHRRGRERPLGLGSLRPVAWPWTINAGGVGIYLPNPDIAIYRVRALQSAGIRAIDVGCFQVDLFYHPDAFASLDAAFDPAANAQAAARILIDGRRAGGSWQFAIALYHSASALRGGRYPAPGRGGLAVGPACAVAWPRPNRPHADPPIRVVTPADMPRVVGPRDSSAVLQWAAAPSKPAGRARTAGLTGADRGRGGRLRHRPVRPAGAERRRHLVAPRHRRLDPRQPCRALGRSVLADLPRRPLDRRRVAGGTGDGARPPGGRRQRRAAAHRRRRGARRRPAGAASPSPSG